MKKNYALILVFFLFNILLQAQTPTISVNSIDAPCSGKGQVTIDLSKVTGDVAVTLTPISGSSIAQVKNGLINETVEFVFNDLPETTYNIIVELNNIEISNNLSSIIKLSSEVLDIKPLLKDDCSGVKVSVDVLTGQAVDYKFILKHTNQILKDWNTIKTISIPYSYFTETTPDDEKIVVVRARDICGNTDSKEIVLRDLLKKFASNEVDHQFKFNSCTSAQVRFKFRNNIVNNYAISSIRYPLTFHYKVSYNDTSSSIIDYTTTLNSPAQSSDVFNINIPLSIPFYGKIFTGELTIKDGCGRTYSKKSFDLVRNTPKFSNQSEVCYEYIYYKMDYPVVGSKITLVNAPIDTDTGLIVALADYSNTTTNYILVKPSQVNFDNRTTNFIIGKDKQLPLGTYNFEENFCGQIKPSQFSLKPPISNNSFYVSIVPGCVNATADISLKLEGQKYSQTGMDTIDEIYVSTAPAAFITTHGVNYPVPLNAFGVFVPGLQNNSIYGILENVPVGEYIITAKIKSICNNKIIEVITPKISIHEKNIKKEKFEIDVNQFCGSFQVLADDKLVSSDKKVFLSGIPYYSTIFLQRYNSITNRWGSLDGYLTNLDESYRKNPTVIYGKKLWVRGSHEWGSGGGNFLDIKIDKTIQSLALNGSKDGKYRIIHVYANFKPGFKQDYNNSQTFRACLQVLKEFEVNLTNVTLDSYNVFKCNNEVTIKIEASGDTQNNPFEYQVIEKNGEDVKAKNPKTTDSVISGLSGEAEYKIEINSSCDTKIININTSNIEFPKIEPYKICSGQNASLKVTGTTGFNVEWFVSDDGNNFTTTNIKGNTYDFTPFTPTIHNKVFKVNVSYKGKNICSSKDLIFDLRKIGEGIDLGKGTHKTYLEKEVQKNVFVSLFDYLVDDETQNSGVWTAIDNFTEIKNGTIDLSTLAVNNSYKFKYVAENICQNNKETFVIISIIKEHKIIVPNVITPFQNNNKFLYIRSEGFDAIQIEICNRWGNTVYMSDDYKNDWAGKTSKKATRAVIGNGYLPTGTYFYKLNTKISRTGEPVFKKGWIYITTD